jgi:hypothetical protein
LMETTVESSEICDETTMRKFSRFPKKIPDFKRSQKFISSDFPGSNQHLGVPPLCEPLSHRGICCRVTGNCPTIKQNDPNPPIKMGTKRSRKASGGMS